MAVDPPYRLDPLQNVVNVKWGDVEDGGGGHHPVDCWFFSPVLFIAPVLGHEEDGLWTLCTPPFDFESNPGTVVESCESNAVDGNVDHWFVDDGSVIHCFAWRWAVGTECGTAPNAEDLANKPASPPPGWNPNNYSPNSEE